MPLLPHCRRRPAAAAACCCCCHSAKLTDATPSPTTGYPCTPARRADCPKPPGGLALQQVPQFITVTWDDAVTDSGTSQSFGIVQQILGGLKQRNGCPIPSTYYVTAQGGVYCALSRLPACLPTCLQPSHCRCCRSQPKPCITLPESGHPRRHGASCSAGAVPVRQRDCDAHADPRGLPQCPGGGGLPRLACQQDGHPPRQKINGFRCGRLVDIG